MTQPVQPVPVALLPDPLVLALSLPVPMISQAWQGAAQPRLSLPRRFAQRVEPAEAPDRDPDGP